MIAKEKYENFLNDPRIEGYFKDLANSIRNRDIDENKANDLTIIDAQDKFYREVLVEEANTASNKISSHPNDLQKELREPFVRCINF